MAAQKDPIFRAREVERKLYENLIVDRNKALLVGDQAIIDQKLFLIEEKRKRLAKLDSDILKILVSQNVDPVLLHAESTECAKYQVTSTDLTENIALDVSPNNWKTFWEIYEPIHEDTLKSTVEKCAQLKKLLKPESKACNFFESYNVTDENYDVLIEGLIIRYGCDEAVIDYLTRKVIKLRYKNLSINEMYLKMEEIVRHLKLLKSYSKELDWMLYPLLQACLSFKMNKQMKGKEERYDRVAGLLTFLKDYSQNAEPASRNWEQKPQQLICVFCDQNHESRKCPFVIQMTHAEKIKKIRDKNQCFICLDGKHFGQDCPKGRGLNCKCGRPHYTIMCPDKEAKIIENKPIGEPKPKVNVIKNTTPTPVSPPIRVELCSKCYCTSSTCSCSKGQAPATTARPVINENAGFGINARAPATRVESEEKICAIS